MNSKKFLHLALFIIGILLFAVTIRAAGMGELLALLPMLAGTGWLFVLIYPFMCAFDVAGWQLLFEAEAGRIKFGRLSAVRLAGEAVNNITPFIDIGGEFLKVSLVMDRLGVTRRTAVASVVVARSLLFFSEIVFWMLGLSLAYFFLPVNPAWNAAIAATLVLSMGLGSLLIATQRRGFFLSAIRALERFGLGPAVLEKFHMTLREVDQEIAAFYAKRQRPLVLSFFLHLGGWAAGSVETYILFYILGSPISWTQAFDVEALLQMLRTASFFIPGNLGAQEAGLGLMAKWAGASLSLGVGISLLKRLRQLVWTAVGFAVWGFYQSKKI